MVQVVPGAASGSTPVYEDDGQTTAYLTSAASAWTTGAYTMTGNTATFTVSTNGTFPELPSARAYQVQYCIDLCTRFVLSISGSLL